MRHGPDRFCQWEKQYGNGEEDGLIRIEERAAMLAPSPEVQFVLIDRIPEI